MKRISSVGAALLAPLAALAATPTFNRDIAPILYRQCATCHHPGEVAPFSLLTYQDAARRARTIAAVTETHFMPPWKADPGNEPFANERRLSDHEIALIREWSAAGAPEGDAVDKPLPPKFADGWRAGRPDQVLTMPQKTVVPADGPDMYRCFVLPRSADADIHVRGIEFRPGNRRVVHHALVFLDSSGAARKLAAGSRDGGYPCFGGPGFQPSGMIAGWAPGASPSLDPPDMAQTIGKGTDIVVQLHYHPTGKLEEDQSSLGLTLSGPPTRGRANVMVFGRRIDIPAGDANYVVRSSVVLPRDVEVIAITPHAHYLGKDLKVEAHLPDGTVAPLIRIRDWDFNWQGQYRYSTPLHLPKGTRVELEYVYDNSDRNPQNPSSPPVRVTWGEETRNEMALAFLAVVLPSPDDVAPFKRAMRLQYLGSFLSSVLDLNDLPPGIEGVNAERLKQALRMFDKNGDGKLDAEEKASLLQFVRGLAH